MTQKITRRNFVQSALVASGGLAVSSAAFGEEPEKKQADSSKKNKLNVACVGIAHMGTYALRAGSKENIVALCDVDWREDKEVWSDKGPSTFAANMPDVPKFSDYRDMLNEMSDQIDVVLISTPDHTHFPIAMAAMEKGKHVFVQKPLAHNIWQVRTLQKAMHKYNVHTVMGNQGHCSDGIRYIKEWVDAGIIGDVREVHCWTDRPSAPWFIKPETRPLKTEAVPEGLDWNLWQGPVADHPYAPELMPVRWRAWWDYGSGCLGDIGCHCLDAPFYALQLGMPTAVDVKLEEPADEEFTAFGAHVTYHFPARDEKPPVTLHWYEGTPQPPKLPGLDEFPTNGMYMVGSKETIYHEGMRPYEPTLWPTERMDHHGDALKETTLPRIEDGPIEELFRTIKGEGPEAGSNFDYAAPLTEVVLLGGLAIRTGKRIEWDAENMKITNHPDMEHYIKEATRPGWEYGEELGEG